MFNYIKYFLLCSLFMLSMTQLALADTPMNSVTGALKVYIGPNAGTPILTSLKVGDTVEVVSATTQAGWILIRLADGQLGWIPSAPNQLKPIDMTAPRGDKLAITVTAKIKTPLNQRLYIAAPQVKVHIGAGATFPEIAQLQQGQIVTTIEQDPMTGWWLVRLPDARIGWVTNAAQYTHLFQADQFAQIPITPTGTIIFQPHSGGPIYAIEAAALNQNPPLLPRYIDTGIDPALSPDGTKLAYTTYNALAGGTFPSENGALWLYDMKSGEKHTLMKDVTYEPKAVSWSPDGQEIVMSYQHGGRPVPETRCYSNNDNVDTIPEEAYAIHYDQNGVCFKLDPDTHWKLRKVNIASGEYQDLPSEQYSFAPTWDPINPWRVVFFTPYNGLLQLDLHRGVYFPFFSMPAHMFRPVFSPDGSKVAVTIWLHDHWEIYTLEVATATLNKITAGYTFNQEAAASSAAPAWSPDSRQLIFLTNRSGSWLPWIMDADGSNPRPLFPPEIIKDLPFEYRGVHEQLFSWR